MRFLRFLLCVFMWLYDDMTDTKAEWSNDFKEFCWSVIQLFHAFFLFNISGCRLKKAGWLLRRTDKAVSETRVDGEFIWRALDGQQDHNNNAGESPINLRKLLEIQIWNPQGERVTFPEHVSCILGWRKWAESSGGTPRSRMKFLQWFAENFVEVIKFHVSLFFLEFAFAPLWADEGIFSLCNYWRINWERSWYFESSRSHLKAITKEEFDILSLQFSPANANENIWKHFPQLCLRINKKLQQ